MNTVTGEEASTFLKEDLLERSESFAAKNPACRFESDSNPAGTGVCLLVRTDVFKSQKTRIIIDSSRRVEWKYAAGVALRCRSSVFRK